MNKIKYKILITVAMVGFLCAGQAGAATTPVLSLSDNGSSVGIKIMGADPNATVLFYFPNQSTNNSTSISYTSIDIGKTGADGSFNISVGPNSYGLNGGVSVFVSVNGAKSIVSSWPTTVNSSSQTGSLFLSKQSVTLSTGQNSSIFGMNTANNLTVQGNSNPSVASAYVQASNNSVLITAMNVGSSTISICAGTAGCGSVAVSVKAPTQSITFSQSEVYIVTGQPAQNVSIYGPGSYYGLTNSNKDAVSASINGNNIALQALAIGKATVSVCADGWICGSIVVNSVSPGSYIPTQVTAPAPTNSNFSQAPQLSSFSISSNNVLGLFFGKGSTISFNFNTNQTVSNVQVRVAGIQATVNQGNDGRYYASYMMTGNDTLPLPVVVSFTNPSGVTGQGYFWIGNSATLPASMTVPMTNSIASPTVANGVTFTQLLSIGSTGAEVKALQERLKNDGLYSGPITGTFGALTEAAVKKYQAKNSLNQVGVVGPGTRKLLNQGI